MTPDARTSCICPDFDLTISSVLLDNTQHGAQHGLDDWICRAPNGVDQRSWNHSARFVLLSGVFLCLRALLDLPRQFSRGQCHCYAQGCPCIVPSDYGLPMLVPVKEILPPQVRLPTIFQTSPPELHRLGNGSFYERDCIRESSLINANLDLEHRPQVQQLRYTGGGGVPGVPQLPKVARATPRGSRSSGNHASPDACLGPSSGCQSQLSRPPTLSLVYLLSGRIFVGS
ncbi:hypothetical protein K474DRAFT_925764 [Panus rudis PR-1116 ss-1]|nr:hypothetical protein K474DRAFT_925764 [Panus rudis PR-1116 ss-1]